MGGGSPVLFAYAIVGDRAKMRGRCAAAPAFWEELVGMTKMDTMVMVSRTAGAAPARKEEKYAQQERLSDRLAAERPGCI